MSRESCLQGGVVYLFLWCLVVDKILQVLNDKNISMQGYTNDLAIPSARNLSCAASRTHVKCIRDSRGIVQRTGLLVNLLKTGLVIFTHENKVSIGKIRGATFEGIRLIPK